MGSVCCFGELPKWSKGAHSKCARPATVRGFESLALRSSTRSVRGAGFNMQRSFRMGSIYQKLTESDIEKIKAELHERICVTRHEILEEVKEARAQGDYSENYELYAAKRAKGQNESRIRYLQNVLKNATIISDESPVDEVGINNTRRNL